MNELARSAGEGLLENFGLSLSARRLRGIQRLSQGSFQAIGFDARSA